MAQLIDTVINGDLDVEGAININNDLLIEDSELETLISQISSI